MSQSPCSQEPQQHFYTTPFFPFEQPGAVTASKHPCKPSPRVCPSLRVFSLLPLPIVRQPARNCSLRLPYSYCTLPVQYFACQPPGKNRESSGSFLTPPPPPLPPFLFSPFFSLLLPSRLLLLLFYQYRTRLHSG